MTKTTKILHNGDKRNSKTEKELHAHVSDGFTPCSQDMTICGDCESNRAKKKCPRLKEWLAKRN
jgi:hypothetical protein